MCLAVPARVKDLLPDERALVDLGGVEQEVSTALIDDLQPGDYVIVHVGFALNRLDAAEAEETLSMLQEMASLGESDE